VKGFGLHINVVGAVDPSDRLIILVEGEPVLEYRGTNASLVSRLCCFSSQIFPIEAALVTVGNQVHSYTRVDLDFPARHTICAAPQSHDPFSETEAPPPQPGDLDLLSAAVKLGQCDDVRRLLFHKANVSHYMYILDRWHRHPTAVSAFESCVLPGLCARLRTSSPEENMSAAFAQYGQDLWVLRRLGWLKGGFFVDVGAAEGHVHSNSYLLEKCFGWNGICVEAQPKFVQRLREVRRRCKIVQCAVTREDSAYVVFNVASEATISGLQQHNEQHAARLDVEPFKVLTEGQSLFSILRQHNVSVVDYLSVDVEGAELAVLQGLGLQRPGAAEVRLVGFENDYHLSDVADHLKPFGFGFQGTVGMDDFFMRHVQEIQNTTKQLEQ